MNFIKTKKEQKIMREGGKITAAILDVLKKEVKPGVSTISLDNIARGLIKKYGAISSFEGYRPTPDSKPYPAVICACVNDEIVHGVPRETILQEGDILSLDFGVKYKGYHTDSAFTLPVGKISKEAKKLIDTTKQALDIGIGNARSGKTLGDLGNVIQKYIESNGFGVVRDLSGHGIGKNLHEDPMVLNYGQSGAGLVLKEGMTIAIEPMVTEGGYHIELGKDGFVFKTADRKLSAHFEHTVVVTRLGGEVLTRL